MSISSASQILERVSTQDRAIGQELSGFAGRALGVGYFRLRDRNDSLEEAESTQHLGVPERLRHYAVSGGDDHQEEVDPARAGDHRPYEALVSRYVHERYLAYRRQHEGA